MSEQEVLPLRMIVEHVYCPRLFHYMHVEGVMVANAHVWRGRYAHAKVDAPGRARPRRAIEGPGEGEAEGPPVEWREARAVDVADDGLGLSGRLDAVVFGDDGTAIPTETKSGNGPDPDDAQCRLAAGVWDADAVHLALQVLALESMGRTVPYGEIWYAGARRRVRVTVDEALRSRTLGAIEAARLANASGSRPPPLVDSPKCRGCSLAEVCLPTESWMLREARPSDPLDHAADEPAEGPAATARRRLRFTSVDRESRTVTVSTAGASVRKEGEAIAVQALATEAEPKPKVHRVSLDSIDELVLMGSVQASTSAVMACLDADIPVSFHTATGRLLGVANAGFANNVRLRVAQHRAAERLEVALPIARAFIRGKVRNQRVLLRRNGGLSEEVDVALQAALRGVDAASDVAELMGAEGSAARAYFEGYAARVEARGGEAFRMDGRHRRPPRDPVNAMLSFGYAVLARECSEVLRKVGFDPMRGLMHGIGWGRPSLALDLMEEFRPLVVDSTVLRLVAERRVAAGDFHREELGVAMAPAARRALLGGLDQRRDEEVTHPVFGYKVTYRRAIELQARVLARVLEGEAPEYIPLTTR